MTAALNQDFVTYAGDSVTPIFTVQDQNGNAVSIATVSDIQWSIRRENETAVLLSKSKLAGEITFVTDGSNGQFQVAILGTDTTGLSGYYIHEALIVDASGNQTTVSVGRMQVGVAPTWTYDPTSIASTPLYQVRRLIGDTLYGDQQMQDQEIEWYISTYSNVWSAAAGCCRALAAQFSRLVDTVQGEMRVLHAQKAKNYMAAALALEVQSKGRGVAYAYAGGISNSDKQSNQANPDRVQPNFIIGMDDNLIPEGPTGLQAITSPMPNSVGGQT